jgi:hypothetical protein
VRPLNWTFWSPTPETPPTGTCRGDQPERRGRRPGPGGSARPDPGPLEITAGSGTSVGGSLENLEAILEGIPRPQRRRVGVCFDTCHAYSAGYDLVGDFDGVWAEFEDRIGLDRLGLFHLNDSKHPFASRKDRHEHIGEGSLGDDPFRRIMTTLASGDPQGPGDAEGRRHGDPRPEEPGTTTGLRAADGGRGGSQEPPRPRIGFSFTPPGRHPSIFRYRRIGGPRN